MQELHAQHSLAIKQEVTALAADYKSFKAQAEAWLSQQETVTKTIQSDVKIDVQQISQLVQLQTQRQ